MNKAKQYHLNFRVFSRDDGRKRPNVYSDTDSNGTINGDVASFMDSLGPDGVDWVVDEIMSLNAFNSNTNGYTIIGSYEVVVEIFSPPARAVFNEGGGADIVIPLQDFLDILHEWKNFLLSLPYKHDLSDK
ncbi:hypothetical protein [Pedobacter sp.]|uniref:hypothetical protein n=1 Tax=Pedobacter sp. TaxID=1411316 RepID=UPI0031E445C2